MDPANFSQALHQGAKEQQQRLAKELLETQERLVTISYDKAAAYTTVIVFGGYAGFFGLWQLANPFIQKSQALWAALLMLVSLATFVFFEITKMVVATRDVFRRVAMLQQPDVKASPQRVMEELKRLEGVTQAAALRLKGAWAVAVTLSVGCALAAAAFLAYALIAGLLRT